MKAIPSPSIHKVDLEPQSVHITSLVEKFLKLIHSWFIIEYITDPY